MSTGIHIYTDGGCSGNPGPGAWAWVMIDGQEREEKSGFHPATTNNRMELSAVIEALRVAGDKISKDEAGSGKVDIYTDSRYVQQGITLWIKTWVKNNWVTSSKQPVKNQDLWKELLATERKVPVAWHWVKGHAGHDMNERANDLVQDAMKKGGPAE